jgi:hypothetical protein
MRPRFLILGLLVLIAVVGLFMTTDPQHAERMAQMDREARFTGETRDMVLLLMAIGLGGFIAYLTITRR